MRLKLEILFSCCCLFASSLVRAKNANAVADKDDNFMDNTTEAPLKKSTDTPILSPIPIKDIVLNIPPKSNGHIKEKSQLSNELDLTQEVLPKSLSQINDETLKPHMHEGNVKTVQVTGFVTKNGNIYEIEDKDGIGIIEGRQNPIDEKLNICNYGNIVIYSDVPCEEVTNIQVGDVVKTTIKDDRHELEHNQNQNQQEQQEPQQQELQHQSNNNYDEEFDDSEDEKPSPQRKGQKRRRAPQNNQIRQRKTKTKNRQHISPNRYQQTRRHQPTPQRHRKQEKNQSRLQSQRYSTQRRQHKNQNRVQQRPHRRGGNSNRNRRQNQRLQQTKRRQQQYDTQHFEFYDY